MQKALFIRRTPDGTILLKPPDKQVDTLEKLRFYPGVIVNLHRIATELDYELVLLTTSPTAGSSTGQRKSGTAAAPAHQKMLEILEGEGIRFAEIV
ncbi:MAG: bifunctional histidinol-phosphatase/imidazoleglycerol-phosphate dehydratase, partial [Calditrichaeota bacterium]